jgi:ribosome-associated protein
MKKSITPAKIKTMIVNTLKDHQAIDIIASNIKTITDIADYIVICTANSTTHAKTLIDKVRERLATIHVKSLGIEGGKNREWMLIDFGDVIVHIMLKNIRQFYALEKLWNVTKAKVKISPKKPKKKE